MLQIKPVLNIYKHFKPDANAAWLSLKISQSTILKAKNYEINIF